MWPSTKLELLLLMFSQLQFSSPSHVFAWVSLCFYHIYMILGPPFNRWAKKNILVLLAPHLLINTIGDKNENGRYFTCSVESVSGILLSHHSYHLNYWSQSNWWIQFQHETIHHYTGSDWFLERSLFITVGDSNHFGKNQTLACSTSCHRA